MYKKFGRHPVYQALSNPSGPTPVFSSPECTEWARLVATLRVAEHIEIGLERPPETGSVQWTDGLKEVLHPELDRLGAQLASLHSKVDALSAQVDAHSAQSGSAAGATSQGAQAATAAAGGPSRRAEEPLQPTAAPKAKASRQNHVRPAKGHVHMREFRQIKNATEMVAEYLRTVALEVNNRTKGAHGYLWRSYQGGSNAWYGVHARRVLVCWNTSWPILALRASETFAA